VTSESLNIYSR